MRRELAAHYEVPSLNDTRHESDRIQLLGNSLPTPIYQDQQLTHKALLRVHKMRWLEAPSSPEFLERTMSELRDRARKVWGTLRSTTTTAVANTIKSLTKLPATPNPDLKIKRKYKTADSNNKRVVKWWFVVRGEEKLLEELSKQWNLVAVQTAWKLEPVQCFMPENQGKERTTSVGNTTVSEADNLLETTLIPDDTETIQAPDDTMTTPVPTSMETMETIDAPDNSNGTMHTNQPNSPSNRSLSSAGIPFLGEQ